MFPLRWYDVNYVETIVCVACYFAQLPVVPVKINRFIGSITTDRKDPFCIYSDLR